MNKIFYIFFIYIIILSSSCAPSFILTNHRPAPTSSQNNKIVSIFLDHDFNSSELKEITDGIQSWNYILNSNLKLDIVDTNTNMDDLRLHVPNYSSGNIFIIKISSEEAAHIHPKIGSFLAFTEPNRKLIYIISDRLVGENLKFTVLHEMGHILGAKHSGNLLMSSQYDIKNYACVDYETALQVSNIWKFDIESMNWCVRKKQ